MGQQFHKSVCMLIGGMSVSSPALADIAPFLGAHCGEAETIYIEETSAGFNEHTICDYLAAPQTKSRSVEILMACRNVYVLDATTDPVTVEETDHQDLTLRMHRTADNENYEAFIDGAPIGRFGACG
jgi:hypothetical protein